jgi:hypothetical protein
MYIYIWCLSILLVIKNYNIPSKSKIATQLRRGRVNGAGRQEVADAPVGGLAHERVDPPLRFLRFRDEVRGLRDRSVPRRGNVHELRLQRRGVSADPDAAGEGSLREAGETADQLRRPRPVQIVEGSGSKEGQELALRLATRAGRQQGERRVQRYGRDDEVSRFLPRRPDADLPRQRQARRPAVRVALWFQDRELGAGAGAAVEYSALGAVVVLHFSSSRMPFSVKGRHAGRSPRPQACCSTGKGRARALTGAARAR